MVAILEPFIDTIIICTLTGMVLLSSGVWKEKHQNIFQRTDIVILNSSYDDGVAAHQEELSSFLNPALESKARRFSGPLHVEDGVIQDEVTVIHARSIAENVIVHNSSSGENFSGTVPVENGRIFSATSELQLNGRSLIHSAPLTTEASSRGMLGDSGRFIIPISLLLFAFSTAIAWSYYGDRAVTSLWGTEYVR